MLKYNHLMLKYQDVMLKYHYGMLKYYHIMKIICIRQLRRSIYVSFNQYSSVLRGDQDRDKEILARHFTKNNGVQQEWIPKASDYWLLPVVVVADAGHVVADVIVCHGYRLSIWQHGTSSGSWQGTRQQNQNIAGSWLLDIDKDEEEVL